MKRSNNNAEQYFRHNNIIVSMAKNYKIFICSTGRSHVWYIVQLKQRKNVLALRASWHVFVFVVEYTRPSQSTTRFTDISGNQLLIFYEVFKSQSAVYSAKRDKVIDTWW